MITPTRRSFLKQAALLSAATLPTSLWPKTSFAREKAGPDLSEAESKKLAEIAQGFLNEVGSPGLSVAVARYGEMVYEQGFGYASSQGDEVTSSHLFRIASVSKPITSATIFSLIEKGDLQLDDLVFGPNGRLGLDYGANYPENVKQMTVRHLLTHTGGGWGNDGKDPMFAQTQMDHAQLIEWTLRNNPLDYAPGTHYAYSNFGYCILGRIIESLTGQSYIKAVQELVLKKCAVEDMRLATNEQAPNEVRYLGQNGEKPYSMNVSRMDSHGGWIATAGDLVRFATCMDGFDNPADILKAETIQTMTTPSAVNAGYACGWSITNPNWWHSGSLPGTSSILVRIPSGLCWAALTNSRTAQTGSALDQMMWKMVLAVPRWEALEKPKTPGKPRNLNKPNVQLT